MKCAKARAMGKPIPGTPRRGCTYSYPYSTQWVLACLQVAPGSVTPFVVANPEAAEVVLLLDQQIKVADKVWAHPLVNTATLAMAPAALDAALRCAGPPAAFGAIPPPLSRPPGLTHVVCMQHWVGCSGFAGFACMSTCAHTCTCC